MNFGELWENVKISSFLKLLATFCQKLKLLQTASNFTCMFLEVIPINSVSFMNFGELWEMSKFLRSGAVGIFLSKIETFPNCFKFHMHFPGSDSNKFFKFREFWRTLRKCQNFILFQRSGAVGIFLSKIETSPNCFKFHIHVPGGDSNKFCKFHEFRRTLRNVKISSFFLGPAVSAFFCQKLKLLQTASNFTCMFLEVIPINSVSFMNFGELWENVKISSFF